jgi:dolichyl-phosphate-mannose-protein mannosyltransferase
MSKNGGLQAPTEKSRRLSPVRANSKGKFSKARSDYKSDGVSDNDVFRLPNYEFQLLGVLTALGSLVRLFRIHQPTSVVFDEVQ